ncbi:hypothetical protein F4803DRAFT_551509 [Xylaria telfairii]|nr:hypothetical protein F4803DRAFT_551509 [Xylaria telfairii]
MIHNIRVQSWLQSIQHSNSDGNGDSKGNSNGNSDTEIARPVKRLRFCDSFDPDDADTVAQFGDDPEPKTPPLTEDEIMSRTAVNKRTVEDSQSIDGPLEKYRVSQTLGYRIRTRTCDKNTPKPRKILLPASIKRPRPHSPTKSRTGLYLLEKPVNLVDDLCQLPSDVETLYSAIQNAVEFKQGILPREVPNAIAWLGRQPPPHCFREPEPDTDASSRAKTIHIALCRIRRAATKSAQYQRHEQGWNNIGNVAGYEPMMAATIAGDSIPLFSGAGLACSVSASSTGDRSEDTSIDVTQVHSSSNSKKVDYALVLHLPSDSALSKRIRGLADDVAIRDREPAPHINQTKFPISE